MAVRLGCETERQQSWLMPARRLLWLAATFVVLAVLALTIDIPVAEFCLRGVLPGSVRKLLALAEAFAHGYGVVAVLLAVVLIDPANRRRLPRLATCVYLPGIINSVVKVMVGRRRPGSFGIAELPDNVGSTFIGWFPAATAADAKLTTEGAVQSFASGHTTAAVGLAVGLSWLYPRGRYLFAALAGLAAMQRVEVGAHYLSDTLAGAALACFVAGLLLDDSAAGRLFRSIENSWPSRSLDETAKAVSPEDDIGA